MISNVVSEALYNCSIDNMRTFGNIAYGRGVFVGVVSTFMGVVDVDFETTIERLGKIYHHDIYRGCIPDSWIEEVEKHFNVVPHWK